MTADQFLSECLKRTLDPDLALECEEVVEALEAAKESGDDASVFKALDECF